MEKMQKSMSLYVKALSKRNEGDDKEKRTPIAYMGGIMINHGEDFEVDSQYGRCLSSMYKWRQNSHLHINLPGSSGSTSCAELRICLTRCHRVKCGEG